MISRLIDEEGKLKLLRLFGLLIVVGEFFLVFSNFKEVCVRLEVFNLVWADFKIFL